MLSIDIECQYCHNFVNSDDFNSETDECNECHDAGTAHDGCRCERCFDRMVQRADALMDAWKDGSY